MAQYAPGSYKLHNAAVRQFLMSSELTQALEEVARPLADRASNATGEPVTVAPEPGRTGRTAVMITAENWPMWREAQDGTFVRAINQG